MVHGLIQWPGRSSSMLIQISEAFERGYAFRGIESGQTIEIASAVKSVSDECLPLLIDEANRPSIVVQAVFDHCANTPAA